MNAPPAPPALTDLHELPSRKVVHQYFVTHALVDCAQLAEDAGAPMQQASQQASRSWECCSLQSAYKAAVLQYGQTPADLQHLISIFAAAVLRVSQGLGGAAGQLLQQRAFSAAEQVHSQLASLQREQQLLSVARGALACAASPAGRSQQPGAAAQQGMHQLPQEPLQDQPQLWLQEHAGLSWRQTLQQLQDYDEEGTTWPALFGAAGGCTAGTGQAFL